jgi:hypothetical protein
MVAVESLTEEQREAVRSFIGRFQDYMETEAYTTRDQAGRRSHEDFFQKRLPEQLEHLSEADIEAVVSRLWASTIWGDKSYYAHKIVEENGIDTLREGLRLLTSTDAPEKAYSEFVRSIKHFGPASTTEILTYLYPRRCGIWNKQAREALGILGITEVVDLGKYQLSAEEYGRFNEALQLIGEELRAAGVEDVDLLLVDFFLYEVGAWSRQAATGATSREGQVPVGSGAFDHDEVRDLVGQIGASLGFDVDTEVPIAHGARVDVVWRARIANLGLVEYVFEVHKSGSMDSLLLNLQKARSAPSVQRVVAVSDEVQLEKIGQECEGLPEEFRRVLRLWPVPDVVETGEHLERVMESVGSLGLIEDKDWRRTGRR